MTGALVRPTFSVNVGSAVRPPSPRSTTEVDELVQLVMQVNTTAAKNEGCAPAASSKSVRRDEIKGRVAAYYKTLSKKRADRSVQVFNRPVGELNRKDGRLRWQFA